MKFLERISKFFGNITVKTIRNTVRITGIDGSIMRKSFQDLLETDRVARHMFSEMTDTSIALHEFFIPDFIHMLKEALENPSHRWATKRTIAAIIHGIEKNTWYKCSVGEVKSITDDTRLNQLTWKPKPHQTDFLEMYGDRMPRYDLRGYILAAPPGTGKTFADLMLATCIIPPSVAQVKIIISPKKAVHLVWEDTIQKVFKKRPKYWVVGQGPKEPPLDCEYYVYNYEQLDAALELAKKLTARQIRYFTIVDESHNFADYKSQRTQKLVKLQTLNPVNYFIWTSGTPVLKSAVELISFLKCADPRFDKDAEQIFKRIYSVAPGRANKIFNARMGKMMAFFVSKKVVSDTKPKVIEHPVKLPTALANQFLMSSVREEMKVYIVTRLEEYKLVIPEYKKIIENGLDLHAKTLSGWQQKRAFDTYRKNLKISMRAPDRIIPKVQSEMKQYETYKIIPSLPLSMRKEFRNALSAIKNIKLKVRGEALGKILTKRRAECAEALGLYCKPEEIMKESLSKTLFFSSAVKPIESLGKSLTSKGFEPLLVYSNTNANLTGIIHKFTNDPNANPICATMQSLSEAVPVIAASTVVFLNRPFRQALWDQIVARADRLGQIHPVTVIEVTLDTGDEPNVSSRTDEILANVRELVNDILGSEFRGPDPSEREYKELIDASQEIPEPELDEAESKR